jgi:hypothetical protein
VNQGCRRLVVDVGVVEKLKVFRGKGRIEMIINIERDSENELKEVLVRFAPFCSLLIKFIYMVR